jgi:hypothetical protein
MENIYYLLCFALCCWYFIFLRKVAESARRHVKQYCQQKNLQYLSIARLSSRLRFNKKQGLYWLSRFEFEFSGDGESQYLGHAILTNYRLEKIDLPAYRVN